MFLPRLVYINRLTTRKAFAKKNAWNYQAFHYLENQSTILVFHPFKLI